MYSSPGTPTGTGLSTASSTYSAVFHTGRPIGTTSAPPSRGQVQQLTSTAASVGPYRLVSTTGPENRSWKRRTSAGGSASPLQTTWRSDAQRPASTASTNGCSMEGTKRSEERRVGKESS